MKIIPHLLLATLAFQFAFAQKVSSNNSIKIWGFEFQAGYTNFDKSFDGGYLSAGYNYRFNDYIVSQANVSFDFGKTSKGLAVREDSYNAGTVAIGIKGELPLFSGHVIRAGPDIGIMLLGLNRADITEDPLLFPIIYGFSASYLVEINGNIEIGLSFSQQYMTNFDFTNQRFGVVLIFN